MPSVLHDLLQLFDDNKASDCNLYCGKNTSMRIGSNWCDIEGYAPDKEQFVQIIQSVIPEAQFRKFINDDDENMDFIFENFLIIDETLGRFLVNLQRQRSKLMLYIRRPIRPASVMYDLMKYAVEHNASDLHIRENKYVRLRVDSKLVDTDFLTDLDFFERSYEEILPKGHLEDYKTNGDYDFAWEEEGIGRFRVNLHRQRGMAAYTCRHVKGKPPTVKEVNLPECLKTIVEAHNGIIFITGTTGSGKSTTMAAMLDHVNNTQEKHIITIEDPIEYTFQDNLSFFEQREVGLDALSFDSALTHALRQDPDIIMVGEMRDRETFETAMRAAETGHLVLTTLHTKDAAQSILRILDMFPIDERDSVRKNLSDCLQAIICQRLAPRATGKGVMPINEILINTPTVKKFIFDNKLDKIPQLIENGDKEGMMSFNQCLMKLVNNGDITEETALQFSDHPQQLVMNLQGIVLSSGGIVQ